MSKYFISLIKSFESNYSFIIIIFLISYIYCDDNSCESCIKSGNTCVSNTGTEADCPQNCKTSNIDTIDGCYYCYFDSEKQYYSITFDDSEGSCTTKKKQDCNSLIFGTKECVQSCDYPYYKLGSYYYKYDNLPTNSEIDSTSNLLKCSDKYYITSEDDLQLYHCLSSTEDCPETHSSYYKEEKLCFNGDCSVLNNPDIKTKINSYNKYECSLNCDNTDYLKIVGNSKSCESSCYPLLKFNNGEEKICITFEECKAYNKYQKGDSCVEQSQCPFYYDNICEDTCGSGHSFHNDGNKECISECTGIYKYLDDTSKTCKQNCGSGYISEDENIV